MAFFIEHEGMFINVDSIAVVGYCPDYAQRGEDDKPIKGPDGENILGVTFVRFNGAFPLRFNGDLREAFKAKIAFVKLVEEG